MPLLVHSVAWQKPREAALGIMSSGRSVTTLGGAPSRQWRLSSVQGAPRKGHTVDDGVVRLQMPPIDACTNAVECAGRFAPTQSSHVSAH